EQISLVLEELANQPEELKAEQLMRLKRRVDALDLVDFAVYEAANGMTNRQVLAEVALVLEELTNL
ncbi:MAG: hypothetical protein ACUVX8_13890, partial [Candidatus Zipacnadales bacterium]